MIEGKLIVVTGGFGVLGQAVAESALNKGAKVVLIDYAKTIPAGLVDKYRIYSGVDLSDSESAKKTFHEISKVEGKIDVLLNIAGGFIWQPLAESTSDDWLRMFLMNVQTSANASHAASEYLAKSEGAIVNIGAAAALMSANTGMGAYTAAKAGVHKLTESMAQEFLGRIRVNAVLPSIIDTAQNRKDMPDTDPSLWVNPKNLANVILFLASDEATEVTGALVPVTGRV